MKSSINVLYNVYAPKAERNHVTHLNRVTRTVYLLGLQFKLLRGTSSLEQMRLLGHVNTEKRCEIQWEALEFSEEHKWLCDSLKPSRRNTVCNETVRRLFNLHIAIIYNAFTVVTLTAPFFFFLQE